MFIRKDVPEVHAYLSKFLLTDESRVEETYSSCFASSTHNSESCEI